MNAVKKDAFFWSSTFIIWAFMLVHGFNIGNNSMVMVSMIFVPITFLML